MTPTPNPATTLQQPDRCPICGEGRVLRIFWGRPLPETLAAVERGEGVLGGCMIAVGCPDWECSMCAHRWFVPDDPVRQEMEAILARMLHQDPSPPPFPEMSRREDGLRERVWTVRMEKHAVATVDLSTTVRDLALAEYRRRLAETSVPGDPDCEAVLDVLVTRTAPRTYSIRIARGGTAPNWDVAADTWVMFAIETLVGPIAAWQGIDRRAWKLWPLPYTPRAG